MPRNSSGTYSLPEPAFVAGTTIRSAAVNSDLSDIATALTQSLATTGVSSMTGPIKLAAGTAGAPSLSYAADATTGFYYSAAGVVTFVSSTGAFTTTLSGAGLSTTGAFAASGTGTFGNLLTVSSGGASITGSTVPLTLKNSTNDALEHTFASLGLGTGAGDTFGITGIGSGANDVTQVRMYIGVTEILRFTGTTFTFQGQLGTTKVGSNIILDSTGFIRLAEISAPASASADTTRIYAKDFGGVTELYYNDNNGVEYVISPPGAVVGRAYGEYTGTTTFSGTIPFDDTIPQSGEGDQIVTATITLQKSTNRVRARFMGFCANQGSTVPSITVAIFCSTSANALNACLQSNDNDAPAVNFCTVEIEVEHAPGSVGPLTYQVRTGGGGNNYQFNGTMSGRVFGGAARATLVLEEIQQ